MRRELGATLRSILCVGAVVALILAAITFLLLLGGFDVGRALGALWLGSVGSWYALTSATLVRAIPLMLTGCAIAVAFRAGVFNIGAEGQLLAGGAAAAAVALAMPNAGWLALALALITGALAGGGWAAIAAVKPSTKAS